MNNPQTPTSFKNKVLSLSGVVAFCYAVLLASPITLISRLLSFEHSLFFVQLERHFWQYLFAFTAVVVLSRGHLWSFGINSQNLKTSMVWLSCLYAVTAGMSFIALLYDNEMLPVGASALHDGNDETIIAMLVYWMSSPVANQILFFSFGQTILMKQWGEAFKIAGIPVAVLLSALIFTFAATTSQFAFGEYSPGLTFMLGLFCGTVYWKTNSLITPMLGHAFFFGFPLFIHIIRSTILR